MLTSFQGSRRPHEFSFFSSQSLSSSSRSAGNQGHTRGRQGFVINTNLPHELEPSSSELLPAPTNHFRSLALTLTKKIHLVSLDRRESCAIFEFASSPSGGPLAICLSLTPWARFGEPRSNVAERSSLRPWRLFTISHTLQVCEFAAKDTQFTKRKGSFRLLGWAGSIWKAEVQEHQMSRVPWSSLERASSSGNLGSDANSTGLESNESNNSFQLQQVSFSSGPNSTRISKRAQDEKLI